MRVGIKEVDEILKIKEMWTHAENKDDILWNALIALAHQNHDLRQEVEKLSQ